VVADHRADHTPTPATSATTPGPAATTDSPAPGPKAVNLPVYFAHDGRLYREFRPAAPAVDDDRGRIRAAVEMSLAGRAADPDYGTLWPAGVTVSDVHIDGATVTVDLAGVAAAPSELAAQQLVYTVSAAATYTSIHKADGVRLFGRTLHQAAMVDVQAPVWVIEPAQGAVVGKNPTVYLAGIVWEGTVNLRIRDGEGKVVLERVVQLSVGSPALGEARVAVALTTGRYTVEAFFISQKDSSVQWLDNHDFTVG
jgi:hypothetical protein